MKEWSVYLQSAHDLGADHVRLPDYVDRVLEYLEGTGAVGSYDPLVVAFRLDVEAVSVDQALTRAKNTLASAFAKVRFPNPVDIVSAEVETIEELDRRLKRSNVPELVGVSEIAKALDVTRQRALEVSRRPDFPRPIVDLAAGPVWNRHAVARFIERWPRKRTGRRPSKDSAASVAAYAVHTAPYKTDVRSAASAKRIRKRS